MFARMPETGAKRERSAWGTTASVMVHGGVILLIVVGSGRASTRTWRPPTVPRDMPIYVAPRDLEDDRPNRGSGPARGTRGSPGDLTLATATGFAPTVVPVDLSMIPNGDPIPFPGGDSSLASEIAHGSGSGGGEPAAGALFESRTVDRDVRVMRERAPRYPDALRAAGVSGVVTVRFVVDTLGRIEPGSLQVIESPNEQFTAAVLAVLRDTRFSPGEARGRAVRVLVQRSFRFELAGVR